MSQERSDAPTGATLFIAERYVGAGSPETASDQMGRVRAASQALAREGRRTRVLGAALVRSDETCFFLLESPSAAEVEQLGRRASVPFERVVDTVVIGTESA